LQTLGRRHDAGQIEKAVAGALRLGFSRINIDLINGYPGQDEKMLLEDLRRAIGLGVDHVSSYNFILEESAPGYAALSTLAGEEDEEWSRRCWELTEEWLCGRGGFRHYEVSNFARPGGECAHNAAIWRGGEYLGVGAAACGYLLGRRFGNTTNVAEYVAGNNRGAWSERLDGEAAARECAVFWLRLYEGIDLEDFRRRTGYDFFDLYRNCAESFLAEKVMECRDGRIRVTPEYMPVLDSILVDLV
jgi:oxygen-independent coproporphyrinogen-3 oxidase